MPTLRDASYGMEEEVRERLEQILNNHKHLPLYYILLYSRPHDTDQILSRFVVTCRQPFKEIFGVGTICWIVNNQEGFHRVLWNIPRDDFIDPRLLDLERPLPPAILRSLPGVLILGK